MTAEVPITTRAAPGECFTDIPKWLHQPIYQLVRKLGHDRHGRERWEFYQIHNGERPLTPAEADRIPYRMELETSWAWRPFPAGCISRVDPMDADDPRWRR